jgi:hypothetical protein
VPALQERFRQVRAAHTPASRPGLFAARWQMAAAALLVLLAAGAAGVAFLPRTKKPELVASVEPPAALPVRLRLAPGLSKGNAPFASIELPPRGHEVQLILELPGVASPVEASARLRTPSPSGGWSEVWSSPAAARSTPAATGQEVVFGLPASQLRANDYVLELSAAPDIRETYVFRLTAAR